MKRNERSGTNLRDFLLSQIVKAPTLSGWFENLRFKPEVIDIDYEDVSHIRIS